MVFGLMTIKETLHQMIRVWPCYLIALVIVLLDQWTKGLATEHLVYAQPVEVTWFFDLRLVWNEGAAFSFLSDAGGWQRWLFLIISAVVSVVIALWWLPTQTRIMSLIGMTLVLGGAVGNLWDRASLGYVIDFISVHYQAHYFPAFNIADSAISVGAVALAIDWLILEPLDEKRRSEDTKPEDLEKKTERLK